MSLARYYQGAIKLAVLFTLIFSVGANAHAAKTAWNFDWDDNVMHMPTKIIVFHKQTGEPKEITTEEFAAYRTTIGKSGLLAEYEIRLTAKDFSYFYFRDHPEKNHFLNDIKNGKFGPSWRKFQFALSHQSTAEWTTVITTRGHSPSAFLEGLEYLRSEGHLLYLPPEKNIFTVSSPALINIAPNPAQAKVVVMTQLLDRLQEDIPRGSNYHYWGFSDDDLGYIKTARDILTANIGRWPLIKIVLYYTGPLKDQHPEAVVLTGDGKVRLLTPEEKYEATEMAKRMHSVELAVCESRLIVPSN